MGLDAFAYPLYRRQFLADPEGDAGRKGAVANATPDLIFGGRDGSGKLS